jgi:hypothetical protein
MTDYAHLSNDELRQFTRRRLQDRPADILEWHAQIIELRALGAELTARVEQSKEKGT